MARKNEVQFLITAQDKATKVLRGFSSTLKFAAAGIVVGTTAAAGLTGGLLAMSRSVAKTQDATAKFAKRIGTTTDALSKMHFAAELGGISTQNMNLAMQRATRRIGEASKNMGEAQGALKELNLNAVELSKLPLDKRMEKIADSLAGVENQTDRLRLAFKLFDSEGTAILQVIGDGGDAFRKAGEDLDFLGATIMPQAAANSEVFNDQLLRLSKAGFGLKQTIANEVIPIFSFYIREFTNWVAQNREKIAQFVKGVVDGFARAIKFVADFVKQVKSLFNEDFFNAGGGFDRLFDIAATTFTEIVRFAGTVLPGIGAILVSVGIEAFKTFFELGKAAFQQLFDLLRGELKFSFKDGFSFEIPNDAITFAEVLEDQGRVAAQNIKGIMREVAKDAGEAAKQGLSAIGQQVSVSLDLDSGSGSILENKILGEVKAIEQLGETANKITANSVRTAEQMSDGILSVNETTAEFLKEIDQQVIESNNMMMESQQLLQEHTQLFWEEEFARLEETKNFFAEQLTEVVDMVATGIADTIVEGQNFGKIIQNTFKTILKSVIGFLVKAGIQRLLLSKIITKSALSEGTAELAKGVALTGVNTFASVSAAPWPFSLQAPSIAASHLAGAKAMGGSGLAAGAALAAGIPIAHGGLDFVPSESTFLLQQGERVLQPAANRDLTSFLSQQSNQDDETSGSISGDGISVENVNIQMFPNAATTDVLEVLSSEELGDAIFDQLLEAFDRNDKLGVRPNFAERSRTS